MRGFTIWGTLLMLLLIYNYGYETDIYELIFRERLNTPETWGHNALTYAQEFSMITSANIFLCNFVIFMIYFYFCLWSFPPFGVSYQIPLLCQFLILFFYCNKHYTLHVRILAMDKYETKAD